MDKKMENEMETGVIQGFGELNLSYSVAEFKPELLKITLVHITTEPDSGPFKDYPPGKTELPGFHVSLGRVHKQRLKISGLQAKSEFNRKWKNKRVPTRN